MSAPDKYPLAWPDNLPRSAKTRKSQFKTSLSGALNNVRKSLEMFAKDTGVAVEEIVLSSNVGGLDEGQPDDPGVAAWFSWDGEQRCIAVDLYPKVESNLQAIHHILEARRTELRHGGLNIVRQTFRSFVALPSPNSARAMGWRQVLGFKASDKPSIEEVDKAYRRAAASAHPDKGGSTEAMARVNQARAEAREELGQ